MNEYFKKRIKRKILIAIIPLIPTLLIVLFMASGLMSVSSFVSRIFSGTELSKEEVMKLPLDDMLKYVNDSSVITEETLDEMMIERDTLRRLLKRVKKQNTEYLSKDKTIKGLHEYIVEYEEKDEKTGETVSRIEHKTDYVDISLPVSTKNYEYPYKLHWQAIYLTSVMETYEYYRTVGNLTGKEIGHISNVKNENASASGNLNVTVEGGDINSFIGSSEAVETKYDAYFEKAAKKYEIPINFIKALAYVESGFDPKAKSGAGAIGIMQLLPTGAGNGYTLQELYDPETNIMIGTRYIVEKIREFDNNVVLGLTAYNRGSGGTRKLLQQYGNRLPTMYLSYASKVLSRYTNGVVSTHDLNKGMGSVDFSGGQFGQILANGRFSLTEVEIELLMDDFMPVFHYFFDVVRDETMVYSFEQCQSLPNNGLMTNGGDPNTKEGRISWYEPKSLLDKVEFNYVDIIFVHNGQNVLDIVYKDRTPRYLQKMAFYWSHWDGEWYQMLIKELPRGNEPIDQYMQYMYLCGSGSSSNNWSGGQFSDASGNYVPLKDMVPSIEISSNMGGMGIPLYTQWDSRWGEIDFGGGDISSSGCSITSLAMVISYLKEKAVSPADIQRCVGNRYYVEGEGQSWAIFEDVAGQYGLSCKQYTVNSDRIVEALKAGKPVIVSTSGYGTTKEFTSAGHFIVLRGLTADGMVLVNDPNDKEAKKHYAKAYSPDFIVNECKKNGVLKGMWVFSKK